MTLVEARKLAQKALDLGWNGNLPVNPVHIANAIRVRVKRSDGEKELVDVIVRRATGGELQGASSKAFVERTEKGLQYVILFNDDEIIYRNRFAIAHELGHVMLGHLSEDSEPLIHHVYANDTRENQLANEFALALILPDKMVRWLFPGAKTIQEFAEAFGISTSAATTRVKQLGML